MSGLINTSKNEDRILAYIFSGALYLWMILGLFLPIVQFFNAVDYFHSDNIMGFSFLMIQTIDEVSLWQTILVGIFCWIMLFAAITFAVIGVIRFLKGQNVSKLCNIIALVMCSVYGFLGIIVGIESNMNLLHATSPLKSCAFSLSFIAALLGGVIFALISNFDKKLNTKY